jgi:hypothetical protein
MKEKLWFLEVNLIKRLLIEIKEIGGNEKKRCPTTKRWNYKTLME